MGHDGTPIADAASEAGIGRLAKGGHEAALLALIGGWLPPGRRTEVIACGMVGSRQGWVEAPYAAVPCPPLDSARLAAAPAADPRLSVRVVPGLKQVAPADVMRGEETQIAGFLAGRPGFEGIVCLPGTHSKWARVAAGRVLAFRSFMTGEMFALLSEQSTLRHGLSGWDDTAFGAAVAAIRSSPGELAATLFGIRAEGLVAGLPPGAARARLSGALIGAELAGVAAFRRNEQVVLIGAEAPARAYAAALALEGVAPEVQPAAAMTLSGLARAHSCEGMRA
ncbi:MAG: 2-dehydro-3-deoxygalactonokinase [Rhodobacteraceae bacterium]|jgi:2-dehydro-3-deoxygalactonokinase|nr:2-dehydro-3-deoxygalactonokinase [Paracoccaceae bacterium]